MNTLDIIHELTHGKPYVLVVMAYKEARTNTDKRAALYKLIKHVVEQESQLVCLRADELMRSGHELLEKIHILVDRASLVIAEISDARPNVFYEVGYAMGSKKESRPILLIERGVKPPYDLQGLEVFEYENTMDGVESFRGKFAEHLRMRLKPVLPLLRKMLAPSNPEPSYIVTSPKYPGKHSRIQGQVFDSRTFGDHVGILGLISAFGLFYGDAKNVELISAQHAPPDLLERDINLYLIGSRKVNKWSRELTEFLTKDKWPRWEFDPHPKSKCGESGDWLCALFRAEKEGRQLVEGQLSVIGQEEKAEIWTSDYGVLLRGPHPKRQGRLAFVLAGAHSLGTAAACLTATRSSVIERLRVKLPEGVLEDRTRTFWALVKGTTSPDDYLIREEDVEIVETGVYS